MGTLFTVPCQKETPLRQCLQELLQNTILPTTCSVVVSTFIGAIASAKKVKAVQPKSIIDLATGSGDVAFKLREQLPSDCTIKGMDFCLPMLEEARRKSKLQEKYSNLQFELGDCMDLPLEDCCCDAVTLSFGLRNFENRRKGLQEILRILKPKGTLFVLEFTQPSMAVASLLLRVPKLLLTLGGTHRNRR